MDVRTAFLHGLIKEQLYMSQPSGFRLHGKESHVCCLYKSLYGLKQSPRAWYERIDAALRKMGLCRSRSDANLYFMHQDGDILIVLLYVDDLFITGSSPQLISWLKTFLHKEFDMTDLGLIRRYLGISFEQVLLGIFLHQRDYTSEILKEFGMAECKPTSAPLPEGLILTSDMNSLSVDPTHYCRLIGKLLFLSVTRPDIIYAVSRLSSYMAQPQTTYLDATKHLLRYLQGTMEYGILYRSGAPTSITGFTDADWGSCTRTRRSMGAYVFMLAGGSITWQCKRQLIVSRSSTKSEYRALSDGTQEVVWLHRLLAELLYPCVQALPLVQSNLHTNPDSSITQPSINIYCDNQGAIKLSHNPIFHARTKHIEIHYHFIRERVLGGEIRLHYIHTNLQPADALTKPLGRVKFQQHRSALGLHYLQSLKTDQQASPSVYNLLDWNRYSLAADNVPKLLCSAPLKPVTSLEQSGHE